MGRFDRIEVVPLLDEQATKENILLALDRLAGGSKPLPATASALEKLKPTQPEDAVFVSFAGHGAFDGSRFYIIPHDFGKASKQSEAISDLELEQAFETMDAGHIVLVIDACQSGGALNSKDPSEGPMNSKGLAQLAYDKGMYVLTAAQWDQAAMEATELGHGLLTFALGQSLQTDAADIAPEDGKVTVREWLDYAAQIVPQLQLQHMVDAHKQGREIAFVEGEETRGDPKDRSLQNPRAFYRREIEFDPLIMAKLPGPELVASQAK